MKPLVSNFDAFMKGLRVEEAEIDRKFSITVMHVATLLQEEITRLTPVNTGRTLASYVWSVGTPVEMSIDPILSGETRGTNSMPLGPEPRRGPNMSMSESSFRSLDFSNPYQRFWLANDSPAVAGLEYGLLPDATGFVPRSPRGMFAISVTYVGALLHAGAI